MHVAVFNDPHESTVLDIMHKGEVGKELEELPAGTRPRTSQNNRSLGEERGNSQ